MTSPAREDPRVLAATALAVAASVLVLLAYGVRAKALVGYPWDWSPDEGLYLDGARRMAEAPASLYQPRFVPFPSAYGPVLPLLLAPFANLAEPLPAARLVALAFTLAGTAAVFILVRRVAPPILAIAATALALAPFDLTFWHVLVRPDGPMLALLLLAAIPLLPRRLARGADELSRRRIAVGTALLLAAVLTKATAAVHAAPLVLGWLLVDRRSAVRLLLALGTAGVLVVAALQWATDGGFLWVNRVWGLHPTQPWLPRLVLGDFLGRAWPLLAGGLLALLAAGRRWRVALTDGGLLLLAGAVAVLPLTGKYGASWNYLLLAVPALAVLTGRAWAAASGEKVAGIPRATAGAVLTAFLALLLAATRPFPLPTSEDERSARSLYTYVSEHTRASGGPILALRPEMAYVVAGQTVEMEGSGFVSLARGKAPGTELVLERLEDARYSLVVLAWPLPDFGGYPEALRRSYVLAGGCKLGYYFGAVTVNLLPRRDVFRPMEPRTGTRCGAGAPAAPSPGSRRQEPKEGT